MNMTVIVAVNMVNVMIGIRADTAGSEAQPEEDTGDDD